MRREYSRIAGVESVDTRITGAVVKLKVGNKASLEHFWTIADKLNTEPQEARVVVAGRLIENADGGFVFEVRGTGRTYALKPNAKLADDMHALAGKRVMADATITIVSEKNIEVRLRGVALDSAP